MNLDDELQYTDDVKVGDKRKCKEENACEDNSRKMTKNTTSNKRQKTNTSKKKILTKEEAEKKIEQERIKDQNAMERAFMLYEPTNDADCPFTFISEKFDRWRYRRGIEQDDLNVFNQFIQLSDEEVDCDNPVLPSMQYIKDRVSKMQQKKTQELYYQFWLWRRYFEKKNPKLRDKNYAIFAAKDSVKRRLPELQKYGVINHSKSFGDADCELTKKIFAEGEHYKRFFFYYAFL